MPLLVDRSPTVDYDDPLHSVKFVIAFKWGSPSNPVPLSVVVLTKIDADLVVAATLTDSWQSYDDAVDAGKEAANEFVSCYWLD